MADLDGTPLASVGVASGGAIVFVIFSNRLGCAGSILVSLIVSAILILIFWSLNS